MHATGTTQLQKLIADLRSLNLTTCSDEAVGSMLRASACDHPHLDVATTTAENRAYTRTLLYRNDDFELLALYWPSGAATSIHDHGGRRCWFGLVAGSMRVENFRRTDDGTRAGFATIVHQEDVALVPGDVDVRSNDLDLHRCVALQPATMTLHIYARPLEHFKTFAQETASYTECTPSYDAVLSLI
ncbi:MAG: cysteine dioxygenase [Vulcanimicrobiaceae bacterium]